MRRVEIGAEQVSVFVKIPARRDGYDEFVFVGNRADDWLDDTFDSVRFDGDDDHVGRCNDFGRVVQWLCTHFHRGLFQLVVMRGASHDVGTVDGAGCDESFGDGLRHIAVSDESDGWIGHGVLLVVFSNGRNCFGCDGFGEFRECQNSSSRSPLFNASSNRCLNTTEPCTPSCSNSLVVQ